MQMAIPLTACMLETDSFYALIRAANAGDGLAFERIMERHQAQVLRFAQRILLNREAARDAAQEVFLRLYKNLSGLDEARPLEPWLYRTASNVCYDALRRAKTDLPIDLSTEPIDEAPDPEQSVTTAQQKQLVWAALKQLGPREREVIALRDLEGYATADVAALLGVSEGTVRSQLSTGRVKLKNFICAAMRRRS
jgi:RNA polymerase sigma-70 factor (ECF subfamily)